jgi:hypothetical protein
MIDRRSFAALVAYNSPSGVTVHRIAADGTVGEQVKQAACRANARTSSTSTGCKRQRAGSAGDLQQGHAGRA